MQYKSNKKKSKGFYFVLAVCILAIGVTSYLAFSDNIIDKKEEKSENESNSVNIDKDSAYNDTKEETPIISEPETEATENVTSDVPYTTKEKPNQTEIITPKQSFSLPINGKIIKPFSNTALQYDKTFGDMRLHEATDIACKENEQILSISSGTVTDVKESSDFLNMVIIDHGNGYTAEYCGLGSVCVKKGESIGAGVIIGTAKNPNCECMDECHIHLVCKKDGVAIDPISLFGKTN